MKIIYNCAAFGSTYFCASFSRERKPERIEIKFKTQNPNLRCVQIPTMLDIREALKKSVLPKRKQDQIELSKNRKHILKNRNEQRLQDQMIAMKKS